MADASTKTGELRFRPPEVEAADEVAWLLRAAFADDSLRPPPSDRIETVLDLAGRLGLAAAIGARQREWKISPPLPAPLAENFKKAHAHAAIRTAVLERSARHLASTASRLAVPIVFLKGFALFLTDRDWSAGRPIADLDLLAPEADAKILHAELRRNGYRALGERGNEHHLAPLVAPEGSNVDLHFCLRGLAFDGPTWATWQDLRERDFLEDTADYPGDCAIPESGALTAHLLVHGLSHHIWRPQSYPLLQLLGDLIHLLPNDAAWQRFENDWRPILLRSVAAPELDALRRLALSLRAGRVPDLGASGPEPVAVLLRHILAGYLDPSYGRRLRLRHALDRLRDAVRQGRLVHYLARKTGRNR